MDKLYWSFLIVGLLILAYTAWAIKGENKFYLTKGKTYSLGGLKLFLPPWWGLEESGPPRWRFERQDEHYDWSFSFEWHPGGVPLPELAQSLLDKDAIILDNPNTTFQEGWKEGLDLYRLEGSGTKDECERVYLDLALVFHRRQGNVAELKSLSSVLTAPVEGPYFEEVLKNLGPLDVEVPNLLD